MIVLKLSSAGRRAGTADHKPTGCAVWGSRFVARWSTLTAQQVGGAATTAKGHSRTGLAIILQRSIRVLAIMTLGSRLTWGRYSDAATVLETEPPQPTHPATRYQPSDPLLAFLESLW